jgi:glycine/D-amino acid oxidase-like deaminating enzyme
MNTRSYDVIIIGGGIVGVCSAWFLAKAGKRVAVVEKGGIAGEQSSRNWGSIRSQARPPAETPIMLDALEFWKSIESELGESVEWCQQGQMLMAYDEGKLEALAETIPNSKAHGIPSRLLNKSEIREVLPHFKNNEAIGALFNPLDGCAEPEIAVPAIARGIARLGVDIFEHTAAFEIETSGGAISGVQTELGLIKEEAVVVARA